MKLLLFFVIFANLVLLNKCKSEGAKTSDNKCLALYLVKLQLDIN